MRTAFSGSVLVVGLLLAMTGVQVAVAQASREPTLDDRYRDADSERADMELPRLNAPQSRLTDETPGDRRNSTEGYLGAIFAASDRMPIVRSIAPGSPAEQAGLQADDEIDTLQGRRVRTKQEVFDILSRMRPGDVLDIGFIRRMSIRTQAPLASAPPTTPQSVGYAPDLPASSMAAPEDPQAVPRSSRYLMPQNRDQPSTRQRRIDDENSSQSNERRRLLPFGRVLRRR
jgi:membrane-associated protease RseP (regulator of RpoE activity)